MLSVPINISSMNLVEREGQRDSDAAAEATEGDQEVVADVEKTSQASRQREEEIVEAESKEDDDDEDGDRFVKNVT